MNKIKKYVKAREELGEYFRTDILYNIIIYDEETWTNFYDNSEVKWDLQGDEFIYSIDVYRCMNWASKDDKYTMFVGDNGCGDRDFYVFKNSLRIENV